jgi:glycosyltransferase involved in cell wall biosynthesis
MTRGAQSVKPWKKRLGNVAFFSRMVSGAAAIHCLTQAEAADAEAWGPPVFVVGNGTDLPPADRAARPGTEAAVRFLFIGRLDLHHKGLDLLLEAWQIASPRLRAANASLTIHGPSVAGSADRLHEMVGDWELGDLVSVEGPVLGEEKARAFSSADVFVHTSRFEGHPIAVLESLSYGLPCLLTPGTNMGEEVVAANAGWRVDATPGAIAHALVEIAEARSRLPAMGGRARGLAAGNCTWERVACQLRERYLEVVRASRQQKRAKKGTGGSDQ